MVDTTTRDDEHVLARLAREGGEHRVEKVDRAEHPMASTVGYLDEEPIKGGILIDDRSPNKQEIHHVYQSGPYSVHYREWNTATDGRVASVRVEE